MNKHALSSDRRDIDLSLYIYMVTGYASLTTLYISVDRKSVV